MAKRAGGPQGGGKENVSTAPTRASKVFLAINNTDCSSVVNQYLMSLSVTDNEDDEADDLQVKLQDRSGTWLQKWLQDFIKDSTAKHHVTKTNTPSYTINDKHAGIYGTVTKGSQTYEAALCQLYLKVLGYYNGSIKAKADASVVSAIKDYQKTYILPATGKCDKNTWKRLTAEVKGKTAPEYKYSFKARKKLVIRKAMKLKAKRIGVIPRGKTGLILGKTAVGWYRVKYSGKTGYVKISKLKLSSITAPTTTTTTSKKLKRTTISAKITGLVSGRNIRRTFGSFELDDVTASGPASVITLKATSLPFSGLRTNENTKIWKNTTLKGIAKKLAKKHKMGFLWDCNADKKFKSIKQKEETDIAFIKRLCQNVGYNLKIAGTKIVIYDQAKYESMQEIATFTYGDKTYSKWNFKTGEGQKEYDVCTVKYTNPKTKKVITGTAKTDEWTEKEKEQKKSKKKKKDWDKPVTLTIRNQKVTSVAEAKALAEQRLKLANKFEREASVTVPGNPNYCAGMAIRLNKFGYWSGKYLVSRCKHDISTSSGYTTTLDLRMVKEVKKPKAKTTKFKVGNTVKFKGGVQYKTKSAKIPAVGAKKAGNAKIVKIDTKAKHPYKLQGAVYNKLKGSCNVNGWVDSGTFTK